MSKSVAVVLLAAALGGCAADSTVLATTRKYAYLYCKVRDADPILHQTVDAMIPVVGGALNATATAGCVLIESYSPLPPKVTSVGDTVPNEQLPQ